ncbi:hypothetical protein Pcinc_004739 [Petrolisthes cinctipes]|uniref:Cytochrome c oxidase subunit viia n=1 Tax=Petrolisthes cinctipes TaxID=88211 RepID=A0AAE1KA16_PETCI|nr:hypothetical protein Pcinc_026471 [Petrolisthes cinctipes]KAK3891365.1 hypothetical protein Pcinc_004739 [Petrolisthes cinctipes]
MNTTRALVRTFTSGGVRRAVATDKVHPGYQKIRSKMSQFQVDNGVPIHLKGGVVDNFLFLSTLGVTAVGLGMCFQFFYTMSFPKKA